MAIERERSNIPLGEEFTERAWKYYDSFEAETKAQLPFQRHVDLRTFVSASGENWSAGTYGYTTTLARFPALTLPVAATTETESITPDHPVDLFTDFADTDHFTFALPNFPLSKVNLTHSKIEITSDPEGHCANTKLTAVVSLAESLKAMKEGDSQFVIERSTLQQNEIDLSAITGVRIKIVCNEAETGTIKVMGIKLVLVSAEGNPGWEVSTVDFDNWNGMLRKPNPLDGNITSGEILDQGIMWKSDLLPGYNDPKPVDAEFGIVFSPGSQKHQNEIVLYLRQEPLIFQTQLDLIGVTMSQLDGHPQPDLGTEEFVGRTVGEFDKQPMSHFDHLEQMKDLERLSVTNPIEESWITFALKWGEGKTRLIMTNSVEPGYIFPHAGPNKFPSLNNNTEYLMTCLLEDSGARVRVYVLKPDKSVEQEPIFDTTLIDDDGIFRRRQGRVGWKAVLHDNDAFINSIRPRSVVFAEYQSAPLTSFTSVDGAQLFASYTGNEELWNQGFVPTPAGSKGVALSRDKSRALSAESFRVDTNGSEHSVGITTDFINFTDFTQAEIKFFVWFAGEPRTVETVENKHGPTFPGHRVLPSPTLYPSKGFITFDQKMFSNLIAQLVSEEGTVIPLPMPELETNQWQEVIMRLPTTEIVQTGLYQVQILQPTLVPSTWWIDNVSIFERVVQWSARSVVSDPWKSNYAPWTDFREIVNVNRKGIMLKPRGKELQLRARALRQNATIKTPKLVPRYASLGRLVWPEERLSGKVPPTAVFKVKGLAARTFKFTDESTEGTGAIVTREWSFGDGAFASGNSLVEQHTYALAGEYAVTLITIDRNGLRSHVAHTVVVF